MASSQDRKGVQALLLFEMRLPLVKAHVQGWPKGRQATGLQGTKWAKKVKIFVVNTVNSRGHRAFFECSGQ